MDCKAAIELLNEARYFDEVISLNTTITDSPLTIITGQNGSGKSFIRKCLQSVYIKKADIKIEVIHISMSARTGSLQDYNPLAKVFMYGDEGEDSTGYNSVHLVEGSLRTSRGRDNKHVIILDEPDTGMSEEMSAGIGKLLSDFMKDKPENLLGLYIISHSRYLLKQLLYHKPNHINTSGDETLEEYLNREVIPFTNFESFQDSCRDKYCKISKIIDEIKKSKNKS